MKNRMHICLRPVDRSRDEEVERLLGLGAPLVNDLRTGETGWAVFADPEGTDRGPLQRGRGQCPSSAEEVLVDVADQQPARALGVSTSSSSGNGSKRRTGRRNDRRCSRGPS
jgi:hypothetical protein